MEIKYVFHEMSEDDIRQALGRLRRARVGFWRGLWNRLRYGDRAGTKMVTYVHDGQVKR